MSTTSTTYSRHNKRRSERRGEEAGRRRSSNVSLRTKDFYTDSDRTPQIENGKWSSNKLKNEISSFIAEFSYLTDTQNKTQNNPTLKEQTNAKTTQQNVQVYAARREQMSSPFDDPEARRKGVGWDDQQRDAIVYNVQAASSNKPTRGRSRRTGFRHRPRIRVNKSSSRRSTSRDVSCPIRAKSSRRVRRRFSGFRVSKSRSKRRRTRSCRSVTPMRRRVRSQVRRRSRTPSCSRSNVRAMPFRFRRRRTREVVVKRSKPKVVYKAIEPCSEPTLVTLYPKPVRRRPPRPRRIPSREPGLPCKCDMCTNKYRSLARLYRGEIFNALPQPCLPMCSPCPPICAPCPPMCSPCPPMCSPCPPMCAPCPPMCSPCAPKCQATPQDCSSCSPNWCCNCNTGGGMCDRPRSNQCCKDDCCQPFASRCVKSVCFKFGAVGQCQDSNITHYFHSILDRRACC